MNKSAAIRTSALGMNSSLRWVGRILTLLSVWLAAPSTAEAQQQQAVPLAHCLHYEAGGCGGNYPCYVEPGYAHGKGYWPHVEIGGAVCMPKCPNAHCHGGEALLDDDKRAEYMAALAAVQDQIKEAIVRGDVSRLVTTVESADQIVLNPERMAVQIISGCSANVVVAHYPLEPLYFAPC